MNLRVECAQIFVFCSHLISILSKSRQIQLNPPCCQITTNSNFFIRTYTPDIARSLSHSESWEIFINRLVFFFRSLHENKRWKQKKTKYFFDESTFWCLWDRNLSCRRKKQLKSGIRWNENRPCAQMRNKWNQKPQFPWQTLLIKRLSCDQYLLCIFRPEKETDSS